MKYFWTVALDGTGDFLSIQDALNKAAETTKSLTPNSYSIKIFIKKGTYIENIEVLLPNITIIGEDRNSTKITSNLGAKEILPDGTKRGTFRTATVRTYGNNITLKNLTIMNEAGNGKIAGQALALYTDGDKIMIENCSLYGYQDTVFTGPLPPCNKDGSTTGMGPRGDFPRTKGRHKFKDCFIEGDIDFIFGGAMALFENCEIFSHEATTEISNEKKVFQENEEGRKIQETKGYITAASTPADQSFGYLFLRCKIISNCPKNSVYLGRPWRDNAKTVFLNCEIGEHIKKEMWHDWDKENAHNTTFYAIGSTKENLENSSIANWTYILDKKSSQKYLKEFLRTFNNRKKLD